jgi:uncharacterized integral membrane protein
MPWKLIGFIFFLVLFVIFSSLNLQKTTINFGLFSLIDLPLFACLAVAFVCGVVLTIPFSFITISKKNKKKSIGNNGKRKNSLKLKKDEKNPSIADKLKDEEE